jgi:dTDP-4-amino-4,6-dideoxygalactose transaminase
MRSRGIETLLQYVPPIYRQPVYADRHVRHGPLPVTEQLSQELLCLPVYPELLEPDVTYVVDTLRDLLRR